MVGDRIQLDPPPRLIAAETACWRCGANRIALSIAG
jgi:hypothetical protein